MRKIFILAFATSLFFRQEAYPVDRCLNIFKQEKYLSSLYCFYKSPDIFSPYKEYFSLLSLDILDMDTSQVEKILKEKDQFAISHYAYLYLARKYLKENIHKAFSYIEKVDPKALEEEDIPFYLYLKAKILEEKGFFDKAEKIKKELALKYTYDRFYGYETFRNILPSLIDEDIYQAIDTLLKHRMVKRAEILLSFLDETPKKDYYRIKIYSRLGKRKSVKKILSKIGKEHPFYRKILPYKVSYTYGSKKKAEILKEMKKSGLKYLANKIARGYMRSAFYRGDIKKFNFYASLIDRDSSVYSDRVWFSFLQKYRNRDYIGAYLYLLEYRNIFSEKEKNKINYWMYLTLKHFDKLKSYQYLRKVATSDYMDFYKVLSMKKMKIKKISFSFTDFYRKKFHLDNKYRLISLLRSYNMYRYAYLEARYIYRSSKGFKDYLKLHTVFPEITARFFSYKKPDSIYAYPKPFKDIEDDNLVYAVMRQESFFDPYALSYSNAVGLMQIMPSTGRWIAKKLGDKDFSPYKLFEYDRNIKYGKWFLDYLKRVFKGNLFYTIAAYNGGGVIVRKTIKRNRITDPAEFVEFMPYLQTRNYIKKVYKNYVIYKEMEKEYVYWAYRRGR